MKPDRVLLVGLGEGADAVRNRIAAVTSVSVLEASSGEEALARLAEGGVDAVLTAQALPETTGLDLLEEIGREFPSVPVVLLPASGSESLASAAIEAGAADYIPSSTAAANPDRVRSALERSCRDAMAADRTRELKSLHAATREMLDARSTEALAETVVDAVDGIIGISYAGVHLLDDEGSRLAPAAWTEEIEETIDEPPALGPESLAWDAFESGEAELYDDLSEVEGTANPETPFRTELFVPLGDYGVLIASSTAPGAFDTDDLEIARILGANATEAFDRIERTARLRERERDLRSFKRAVENSGHSIVITDDTGTIEYVNPAFEEMTGYAREEAIGRNPRILKSGEHDREFYREMWETILDGEVFHGELVNERKDGERFVVDQTIAPITGEHGDIQRFVAINREITERKAARERLEEQRDNLTLLNKVVRHDIRNDLQVVLGYAEMLDGRVDGEPASFVETILRNTHHAIGLTKTARDLAQTMLQQTGDFGATSLRSALESQIDEVRESHEEALITVDGDLPDVDVRADEMLDSVFRNLLVNAIDHNDKELPEVIVSATERDEHAVVRIADNGPGVPDAQKSEIFGEGEKGLESGGTGVGLYLVRTLTDRYGGRVRVEDNEPEGSVFVVELPLASTAADQQPDPA
ncbi:MAG: PAS domain S-box protein [Haloquadratum sp.]